MKHITNLAKTKWMCRRGMLELDIMLMPFFENCFIDLSSAEQESFIELLKMDDPLLFRWLMRQEKPDKIQLQYIIEKIIEYRNIQYEHNKI